ncbi:hypothetical protein [Nocardioides sp.]|uniref:hypothetical protein n=1 Tax=Nocardioides sp. TaxID=35761 RepID=UPI0027354948|nr:hypothetical protein [Nocardioides sp.]MDP3893895.1 hypothetical protein [Nocardioides sp.]
MPTSESGWGRGRSILLGVGVLVVLAVCLPLVRVLDERTDRLRPMYVDRDTMTSLQYRHFEKHREALPLEVRSGESITVAGERFSPSAGVVVRVRATDEGYCVQSSNSVGDTTSWRCESGETDPDPEPVFGTEG